jgi:hypothetical protein
MLAIGRYAHALLSIYPNAMTNKIELNFENLTSYRKGIFPFVLD